MSARTVLICQGKTCRKQGSAGVLKAFQSYAAIAADISASGCLGQCGNGSMVLVLPEEVWYSQVQRDQVAIVVKQHLQEGNPVRAMLYRKLHRR